MPDSQTLSPASPDAQTLTGTGPVARGRFSPGTALYEAPLPFPSSTSYPGDAPRIGGASPDSQTLTPA